LLVSLETSSGEREGGGLHKQYKNNGGKKKIIEKKKGEEKLLWKTDRSKDEREISILMRKIKSMSHLKRGTGGGNIRARDWRGRFTSPPPLNHVVHFKGKEEGKNKEL